MDIIDIVKRCKSGDREAFGMLYRTYLPSMKKVVCKYIPTPEVVEDIIHDGFIIAFNSIASLKNDARIEQWLTAIMRNLSMQYLRDTFISQELTNDDILIDDDDNTAGNISWEEFESIINTLPAGYGKVFRLAVLDGLSHKEVGEMLGIAPHSSSSQLTHAKAMLRKLINDYRTKMDIIATAAIILLLIAGHIITRNSQQTIIVAEDNPTDIIEPADNLPIDTTPVIIKHIDRKPVIKEVITEAPTLEEKQSIPRQNDTIAVDTIPRFIPRYTTDSDRYIAQTTTPHAVSAHKSDWALAVSYSGNRGLANINSYPDISGPDPEGPTVPTDYITEKVNHHTPFVIGIALSKSLSSRWSIETGLRYTYLRTDSVYDSNILNRVSVQRIHYIGIPLKFNYRLYTFKGLSIYTQGGGSLDVSIKGNNWLSELKKTENKLNINSAPIHAPVQWSIEGGIGIRYNITPSLSIYAEPSLRYYFNTGSEIKTIRQDKPIDFTVPIGLRFTW